MSKGRSRRRKARWGQNFLVNQGACERIAEAAGDVRDHVVIEVGPGRGALTRHLLDRGARVIALEIDPILAEGLGEAIGAEPDAPRLEILLEDAARADWAALLDRALNLAPPPVAFVANLPYESGTAILQRWLEVSAARPEFDRAIVMLQREVAERVAATPSTKAFGVLSILVQATHSVKTVLDVSPGSFRPVPKVWSRVIRLERRPDPLFTPHERARVVAFVHAALSQRRKQLAGTLAESAAAGGRSREEWQGLLAAHGHAATARAEELSPAEIIALSRE